MRPISLRASSDGCDNTLDLFHDRGATARRCALGGNARYNRENNHRKRNKRLHHGAPSRRRQHSDTNLLPVSSSGALPYTSTCPLTRFRPRKDLIASPCRCRSCALFTVEEGHEPEIHVWLHVAVEEAQARLVSGEVDSHLLEFAEHRNVLHHTRSW
jgi:hypothetical protein